MPETTAGRGSPFSALIGASSIVVAVLYVTGFAFKWAYFYNFGVQHIVYTQSLSAIVISAIELVRQTRYIALILLYVIAPLIVLNAAVGALRRIRLRNAARSALLGITGFDSALVVDALRAVVLLFGCFAVSLQAGYAAFRQDVVDSPANSLPRVTLVSASAGRSDQPLTCSALPAAQVSVIGDGQKVSVIEKTFRACNDANVTWRLLYRDERNTYLFASTPAALAEGRPLTVVVPNDAKSYLIME